MAQVQRFASKSSFILVGDLNAHHMEGLCSVSPTNNHSHAAYNFASLSGYEQLITGATLILTNVPGFI